MCHASYKLATAHSSLVRVALITSTCSKLLLHKLTILKHLNCELSANNKCAKECVIILGDILVNYIPQLFVKHHFN